MENWDDLRILRAVVKGGSITSGAELLGVDQSTISRRLQAFERRLGKSLFHETKKRNQCAVGSPFAVGVFNVLREISEDKPSNISAGHDGAGAGNRYRDIRDEHAE